MIDEELPLIIERLREVQIVNGDGIDVIRRWDSPDTLFYCDPPYVSGTRVSPDVYDCEMDDDAHRELAGVLQSCQGKVVLSGYHSELYDELYRGWRTTSIDVPCHASGSDVKGTRREVLWFNGGGDCDGRG